MNGARKLWWKLRVCGEWRIHVGEPTLGTVWRPGDVYRPVLRQSEVTGCRRVPESTPTAYRRTCTSVSKLAKAKIHYTSFPGSSRQQVGGSRLPRNKSATSLQQVGAGKSPLCLLCRVVSQIPLQRLLANKLSTSPSTRKLQGNVRNGFWVQVSK